MLGVMRSATITHRARTAPRHLVHVAVGDPDLAQDCLAAVAAAGLSARTCTLDGVVAGASVLIVDARAAQHAPAHTAHGAWNAADTAIAVCSELTTTRPLGHEPLQLPRDTPELLRRLERATMSDSGGRMLAVAGAHGGAGTSTFAVCAALKAAATQTTVLIEADPHGPGLDLLVSPTTDTGLTVDGVHAPSGDLDGTELVEALPRREGLAIAAVNRQPAAAAGAAATDTPADLTAAPAAAHSAHTATVHAIHRAAVRAGFAAVCDLGPLATASASLAEAADALIVVARATVAGLHQAERLATGTRPSLIAVRREHGDILRPGDIDDWYHHLQRRGHLDHTSDIAIYKSSARVFSAIETGTLTTPGAQFARVIDRAWEAIDA